MSRYGGDEFVVLCRSTDAAGVAQVRAALPATFDASFVTRTVSSDWG